MAEFLTVQISDPTKRALVEAMARVVRDAPADGCQACPLRVYEHANYACIRATPSYVPDHDKFDAGLYPVSTGDTGDGVRWTMETVSRTLNLIAAEAPCWREHLAQHDGAWKRAMAMHEARQKSKSS